MKLSPRLRAAFPQRGSFALPLITFVIIVAGVALLLAVNRGLAEQVMWFGLLFTCLPLLYATAQQALRGNFATDAIAALAVLTALILRQPLPGLIVVLMQSGGEALERLAQRRATRSLRQLEESAPRVAHRRVGNTYTDVPVQDVVVGDHVLVRPGELIPADGLVLEGQSHVDTAQITGEPIPIAAQPGTHLFSGCSNLNSPLILQVLAPAAESQYERIVQLVRSAQEKKAPLQRLADRYAVWFTPFTLLVAAAVFLITRDPIRILAVLVVATPCPLILATPVAIIGGINRAAKRNVILRSGTALEQLASIQAVVFDKTGTLTTGRPAAQRLITVGEWTEPELLTLAAGVELGSGHVLARAVLEYAQERNLPFALADQVHELPGRGVRGQADGHTIAIGSESFAAEDAAIDAGQLPGAHSNTLRSYIVVDHKVAGYFEFEDELRADLAELLEGLRANGAQRIVILSGDDQETVQAVARQLHVDEAYGDLTPPQKLEYVERMKREVGPTLMIGDGTNDAPALAAATVGLAVTPRGGGIAAETADAILLGENLMRVQDALTISRRTLRIAKQSIMVGLGLSAAGMVVAALGYLAPTAGALYQEAIDVAVILNALRASVPANRSATAKTGTTNPPISHSHQVNAGAPSS